MNDSYILDFLGGLQQKRSQKQVNADIKQLEKVINKLRLTATLAQGSSKKEINAYIKQLSGQLSAIKLKAKIDSKNLKSELDSALNKVSFKDIDVLDIDENKTILKIQKVIADAKTYAEKNPVSIGINYENRRNKLDNDLTAYLNRNTKIEESSALLKEADKVRALIGAINDKKSLREATDAFQLYKSSVASVGFNTKSTTDKIKDMFGHITKLGSIFSVTSLAVNNFTKSLGTLKDIDDILTEISKTSNMTAQELEILGDISFKAASKYGKTASDYLTGIQEMSRSGFYGEKGSAMAEQSLLAQAAGDMNAEIANKYILATNAAYKYNGETSKLNAVLDGQNSITNRNSVALSDMAIAMSEAGTVASSYRVSIEDLSAMIGTMESVTKLGGSEVGNGIKAILINLQNVNSSKITDTLDAANASMTEFVNGTEKLRDPISILRDLAETFNQLDEDDALRAEILTNIGGKHQASKLAALLQNMELFDKMLVDYSEGSGSAMEEAMKSANNLSGRLNQIQNSWDSLVNTIVNKNSVLSGLTFGDRLIQGAESFIDIFGEIPVLLTTINTAMTAMKKDYGITKVWDKESQKINIEGNLFGIDISRIKNLKKHYNEAGEAITKWNKELKGGKVDIEAFNDTVVQNSASLKEYLSTCSKNAPASLSGYKDYLQSTGQATEDLRLKTILLNAALTLLGSIAVQAVITGIASAFDKFNETVVESKEKVDDINSKISDLNSQLEELNNLEYKSDFDKQKIAQLERELELQEKILEIEQKRLYQNQIGTKFSDYFDADSLITKQQAEYDHNNKENFANLSRGYEKYRSSLEDINSQLDALQEKLNSEDLSKHDRFITEGKITELTEKRNNLLEKQQTIEDQLIVNMGEYLKNKQIAQDAIDSGLLTGSDLEKAESMVEYWNKLYQVSSNIVANIQKLNGTYDYTNEHMSQSIRSISDDHGISDRNEYDQLIAYTADFSEEEKKLWLESTQGAKNATEAIEMYEAALAKAQQTANESSNSQTSISQTIDQLNTRLKPAIDSLNSAWNEIFTDDGFKLNSIDILSTCDAIKSKLDEMSDPEGLNLDVDYSAFEDFVRVLSDTESTEDDVDKAFDRLANSITQAALTGKEDLQTLNAALEDLGISFVVNDKLVAFKELIDNTTALEEAVTQAGLTMSDFVVHTEDGSIAATDAATAFVEEMVGAENCQQALALLQLQQMLCNENSLNTTDDINACLTLAKAAGVAAESLSWLANVSAQYDAAVAAGDTVAQQNLAATMKSIKERINKELADFQPNAVDFSGVGKNAKSAGKKAGDAYVDAFEKEYNHLKDMLNRGEISEAQYLNRLRALYTRYFKDRKKYLDEYKKYESEYLTGMLDLHNKALSGISTLLNRKISAANDAKDASINALQEEKEAAAEAYQAQIDAIEKEKDAIDDLIKEKNKKIASLNEEIDAIERAAESRKKNIQLEKDQYNLEKMLNNRSSLVYKDGQFIWDTDTRGIMDAREKVREDQEALRIDGLKNEISLIQKEIDLLEEKKDSLSEEQDRIQKLMDESNKYYDNLIKQQEKMWDSIIKGMEQNKSRWEEIAEVEEIAKAFSYIQQVFGDLGYTVEDVLNGSDAAFEDFKSRYISLISDVNNNSDFTEGLVYATGVAKENLGSFLDKTKEAADGLDELGGKGSEMDSVAESMDKLSSTACDANANISETATNVGNVASNVGELSNNLTNVNSLVSEEQTAFDNLKTKIDEVIEAINLKTQAIQEEQNAVSIATSSEMADFLLLKEKILEIKETLETFGTQDEGLISNIALAIQSLNEISLEDGIIKQFTSLKTAIDSVTAAISGGGGESSEGEGSGSKSVGGKSGSQGSKGNGESGGGDSLTGAIESMGDTAKKVIGESDAEGDGTVIGEFGSMETAVNDVRDAIGTGDSEGGKKSGNGSEGEGDGTLIGSIVNLGDTTQEEMGEQDGDGIIGKFNEFKGVIEEAANQVKSISDGLDKIDGKEVECTITVNVKMNGSIPQFADGTVLGQMQIESATYNAKYGKAFASGTIGLPKAEKNALVSEYGQTEMTVLPDGKTIVTDTPTLMDLPKDTVIYNEEETKKIMDNKVDVSGDAHANGTNDGVTILEDGTVLHPLQPGDPMYDMKQKFDAYLKSIDGNLEKIVPNSFYERNRQMNKLADQISYANNVVNNNKNVQQPINQTFNITMPNITDSTTATSLMNDLQSLATKKYQVKW